MTDGGAGVVRLGLADGSRAGEGGRSGRFVGVAGLSSSKKFSAGSAEIG